MVRRLNIEGVLRTAKVAQMYLGLLAFEEVSDLTGQSECALEASQGRAFRLNVVCQSVLILRFSLHVLFKL